MGIKQLKIKESLDCEWCTDVIDREFTNLKKSREKVKMKEPLISIIVPIFNVEKYVSECVESIMQQDYKNIQIILVDDGSTDKSGELCDRYARQDTRIEVIHQKNKGLVLARKSGLRKAKGDYIGFVDGDDYITIDMYGSLLRKILEHDADFVHSGFMRGEEKVVNFKPEVIVFNSRKDREDFIRKEVFCIPSHISPSIWSKLFKAEFIKECYSKVPDNAQYGEDLINLCICIENCRKFVLIDKTYYCYRYRDESITNKIDFNSFRNVFRYYRNVCNMTAEYECCDELEQFVVDEICNNILYKMKAYTNRSFQVAKYYYGQPDELQGKRIVLYGAGVVGKDYYAQISRYTGCDIVAWVDMYPGKYDYPYIDLYGVETLDRVTFDILVIAVKERKLAEEIGRQLVARGIEREIIVWSEPRTYED